MGVGGHSSDKKLSSRILPRFGCFAGTKSPDLHHNILAYNILVNCPMVETNEKKLFYFIDIIYFCFCFFY